MDRLRQHKGHGDSYLRLSVHYRTPELLSEQQRAILMDRIPRTYRASMVVNVFRMDVVFLQRPIEERAGRVVLDRRWVRKLVEEAPHAYKGVEP